MPENSLPAARKWLLDRKLGPDFVDEETAGQLRPWLEALEPAKLAEHLIGGVARAELPFETSGLLGQTVEILVEGRQKGKWYGRTRTDKLAFFSTGGDITGQLVRIKISKTGPWSLQGKIESE